MNDEKESMEVGLRGGEELVIPGMIAALLITPIFAIRFVDTIYDVIRIFVLMQAGIIIALQSYTALSGMWRMWTNRNSELPPVLRTLRLAHLCRVVATTILVSVLSWNVISRMGNDHLTLRTPILQLCLILLAFAWGFIDRRIGLIEERLNSEEMRAIFSGVGALTRERQEDAERRHRHAP